jgi:tripartite-type tricarboxylate transporter receptor subunit TctC
MQPATVKKLQDAFHIAGQSPEFENCADQFGLKLDYGTAPSYSAYIQDMLKNWTPVLKQFAAAE